MDSKHEDNEKIKIFTKKMVNSPNVFIKRKALEHDGF